MEFGADLHYQVPRGGGSLFEVEGRHSSRGHDEAQLIEAASGQLHKSNQLSKVQKGALADRVLCSRCSDAPFAERLGWLLRQDACPLAAVEVEYHNLTIQADALVGSAGNPSILHSTLSLLRLATCQRPPTAVHTILHGVSGVLKPGRMTLLLGPPSSGKSVLLQALSGRLSGSHRGLRISGTIKYNGLELDAFQPRRTAGLVQQQDNHIPELNVQETVEFAFKCQVGPQPRETTYLWLEAARRKVEGLCRQLSSGDARLAAAEAGAGTAAASDGHVSNRGSVPSTKTNGLGMGAEPVPGSPAVVTPEWMPLGSRGGRPTPPCHIDMEEEFADAMQEVIGQQMMPYLILRIMGLSHATQTLVGSTEARGISGGERKRLTTAEIVVGQQPVVFMDEISTGLDSATAYSVIKTFRDVVHALDRTFLISLLQPAPQVIELFDDVLLLTDGRVIYHGPVAGVLPHFQQQLEFVCLTRKDPGSFLQEVTIPAGQWLYASPALLKQHDLTEADRSSAALLAAPPIKLLTTVEEMQRVFWEQTSAGQALLHQLEKKPFQPTEESSQAVHTQSYGNSARVLVRLVVQRQFLLNMRMKAFYIARIVQTIVMGLIVASLFATIESTPEDGRNAVAVLVLSTIFLSMNSAPQLAFAQYSKPTFYKQRDNQLFPSWSFSLAQVICQVPQSTVESIVFSLVVYWISGLTRTASCFFVYLLLAWSSSNCLASLFRLIGYTASSMVMANTSAMLILLLMIITNGFSLVDPAIPPYMVWICWINPMAWAIKALVINELTSPRWQANVAPGVTVGDTIMEPFGFPPDKSYIWGAVGFLWGSLVVYTVLAALALRFIDPPRPQPTVPEVEWREETSKNIFARLQHQLRAQLITPLNASLRRILLIAPEEGSTLPSTAASAHDSKPANGKAASTAFLAAAAAKQPVAKVVGVAAGGTRAHEKVAVPFTPVTLVCRDLRFYVSDPSHGAAPGVVRDSKDKEIRGKLELLKGISFYTLPGELLALMGGSGAGKTTLMDCVLGRKTMGMMRGDILVNGYPKSQGTWSRVCGYVEQQDIHSGRSTVAESLMFSARLRLPSEIPNDKTAQLVEEVLEMTELGWLRHSIVGEGDGGHGLSVEQRKRLSIAVELVAAPAVMFLDEPTSGLDARAAAIVMRAIQNVARSNRTVVVTIHQPSTEIFESFDMLLLMQLGGRLTYFGRLGFESGELIAYLEAQPGVAPIKPGYNPATWMLEVTGGSMSTIYEASLQDFPEIYAASTLRQQNEANGERLVAEGLAAHQPLRVSGQYAASNATQHKMLLHKFMSIYFRSPQYNFARVLMTIVIALLYGITYKEQGNISGTTTSPANLGDVQNVMGLLFSAAIFVGMFNAMAVQPLVATERVVFYRERAAMMYAPGPYSLAWGLSEIPYLVVQAMVMVNIMYWLVHFSHTTWKYGYFLLMYLATMLMYTLCGQFLIFATPNQLMAQLLTASLNQLWTIVNGFLIPYPMIPVGWKWLNRISPTTWILYGLGSSQLGDSETPMLIYGAQLTTVGGFMNSYFGYDFGFVWWCLLIVFAFVVFFRAGTAILLRFVSYQRR